jgi:nicotinamidase-related amidase
MLLEATKSGLLLVDMQERLLPVMERDAEVVDRCAILIKAARTLGIPISLSEQYPKGLGHTVPVLKQQIGNAPVFEKLAFSCWRDDALKSHLIRQHDGGRPQIVLAGIEAHVCVLQTAIDLAQAGFAVYAAADAMSSRKSASVALALARMTAAGVQIVNTEMAVFEFLGQAGSAEFKSLSALIR